MKPTTLLAVGLIVAGLVAAWRPAGPSPTPAPTPPDEATRAIVADLRGQLPPEDGRRLGAFYSALADVIERDAGDLIDTVARVRQLNRRAGLLMFQRTGIAGKYPGLAQQIDRAIARGMGLEETDEGYTDVDLDAERIERLVRVLRAIAWACRGG